MDPDDPRAPQEEFMVKISYKWAYVDVFGSRLNVRSSQLHLLPFHACRPRDNACPSQHITRLHDENVVMVGRAFLVFAFL